MMNNAKPFHTKAQRVKQLTSRLIDIYEYLDVLKNNMLITLSDDIFFSEDEMTELLKIDKRTLARYRQNGLIPYYKIAGKILYRESEIKGLLEDNHHEAFKRK